MDPQRISLPRKRKQPVETTPEPAQLWPEAEAQHVHHVQQGVNQLSLDPSNASTSTIPAELAASTHSSFRESDDDYEEEVQYVVLDVGTELSPEVLVGMTPENGYAFTGLDTPTPYLEIGGHHFVGEVDETLGTDVIFRQELEPGTARCKDLEYTCHTVKKINFSRIKLHDKPEDELREGKTGDGDDVVMTENGDGSQPSGLGKDRVDHALEQPATESIQSTSGRRNPPRAVRQSPTSETPLDAEEIILEEEPLDEQASPTKGVEEISDEERETQRDEATPSSSSKEDPDALDDDEGDAGWDFQDYNVPTPPQMRVVSSAERKGKRTAEVLDEEVIEGFADDPDLDDDDGGWGC